MEVGAFFMIGFRNTCLNLSCREPGFLGAAISIYEISLNNRWGYCFVIALRFIAMTELLLCNLSSWGSPRLLG